ncbi:peptidoglycan/xylan/chitin deacetylase (PgdA/CDA1 family) [Clostridium saccharobutylicum]|nr:peptidoglycan/xylan/chitin deacetylase (PgdA/CDA1 family) [Clostridium saccharobutylicum]
MKWTTFKKLTIFTLILISITNLQALALDTQDNNNKKTIYLTFDDGPAGKVTSDTLDILKKNAFLQHFFLLVSK